MTRTASWIVASFFVLAGPGTAHADRAGEFGIGVESPLAEGALATGVGVATTRDRPVTYRIPGVSLRYQLTDTLGAQVILAMALGALGPEGSNDGSSATVMGAAVRFHFALVIREDVTLGLVAGVGALTTARETTLAGVSTLDQSGLTISIEVGLRPEWFVSDTFSIHTQVGISMGLTKHDYFGLDQTDIALSFGRNANLFGNAGVTVWLGD